MRIKKEMSIIRRHIQIYNDRVSSKSNPLLDLLHSHPVVKRLGTYIAISQLRKM